MNARSSLSTLLSLSALVVASTATFAAEPDATVERSRADVVSETLAARAAGTLTPAGEASGPLTIATPAASALTRSAVESQVLEARATGTLTPAGEGVVLASAGQRSASVVTRAEVKATVIAARRAGDLVPAGEGPDAELHARANTASSVRHASAAGAVEQVAKR